MTDPTDCPACDLDHPRGSTDCPGRRVGSVFHGKYELVRVLGCGGMGAVYEAIHTGLGRRCAVKVMLPSALGAETAARRFEDEAKRVAALDHPGIVKIHDAGRDASGTLFLEMELLAGESVEAWAATRPTPAACVEVIAAALEGLAVAHAAGIVHRDIKPDNLFVARTPAGARRIVLLDFGIARGDDASTTRTREGVVLGTLAYMSPEQFADASTVDARTDVFAMAATLYRLLVGHPPLDGTRAEVITGLATQTYPRATGADVGPAVERAIGAALDPDPGRRPRDAAAFRAMLVARAAAPAPTELEVDAPAPPAARASAARPAAATELEAAITERPASPTAPGEATVAASGLRPATPTRRRWPIVVAGVAVIGAGMPLALHFTGGSTRAPVAPVVAVRPPIDAAPAHVTTRGMAAIPGGSVQLGLDDPAAFLARCKQLEPDPAYCTELVKRIEPSTATVAPFELDDHEVTRAELAAWLDSEVAHGKAKLAGKTVVRTADGADLVAIDCQGVGGLVVTADRITAPAGGDVAAVCMTFAAATAFCADAGKHLPTSAQFVIAARQPRAPMSKVDAHYANRCDAGVFGGLPHGPCESIPLGPKRAGSAPGDITIAGVRDLAGNVSEWVDDPPRDGRHLVRGGNWAGGEIDLDPAKLTWLGADARGFAGTANAGFRCAR